MIMCLILGVSYDKFVFECDDLFWENCGLDRTLEVCGCRNLFELQWGMLMVLRPKGGDAE